MKIEYSAPVAGEQYLAHKKTAVGIARQHSPDLRRLVFQTRHGPKMDASIPYICQYRLDYVRILSVKDLFATDLAKRAFVNDVLPQVCRRVQTHGNIWPHVVVEVESNFHMISCSEGHLFPSKAEIERAISPANRLSAF